MISWSFRIKTSSLFCCVISGLLDPSTVGSLLMSERHVYDLYVSQVMIADYIFNVHVLAEFC